MGMKDMMLLTVGTLGTLTGIALVLFGKEKETVSGGALLLAGSWLPFSQWGS